MESHNPTREGTIAGIIGASSVALWFLMVDSIAGRPFFTPAILGASLFDLLEAALVAAGSRRVAAYRRSLRGVHRHRDRGGDGDERARSKAVAAHWIRGAVPGVRALRHRRGRAALAVAAVRDDRGGIRLGAANLLAAYFMGRYLWRAHHPAADER